MYQNERVFKRWIRLPLFLVFTLALPFLLFSCSKGFVLKIGDQDLFAFGSVESCNFVQNGEGVRISWKSSVPAHFIITSTVPTQYDQAIIKAASTWNSMKRMNLIEVHRDNNYPNSPANDGTNGIYWMTTWDSEQVKEQGRTSIKWDLSKIRDADIRINAQNFAYFKAGDTGTNGKISVESLMLHEMGHALGLKHITDSNSSMQAYLAAGVSRNPGDVDINSLNCEY